VTAHGARLVHPLLDCLARDAGTVLWLCRAVLLSCPSLRSGWLHHGLAARLWLEGVRVTCHLCVWPQVPLVLQATADLGGRLTEQTLAGKEPMVCAVTTSSLLRHPTLWQCSASLLKLDELINKPDKSGTAVSSIIPVVFNRRPCPTSAGAAQVTWVPLASLFLGCCFSPHKLLGMGVNSTGVGRWEGLWLHFHVPRVWQPGVEVLLKVEDNQVGQWVVGSRRPRAGGELLAECWKAPLKMGDDL